MNTESNWYDLIEQYNLGLLTAEQAARFETAMRADAALAAAVGAHRTQWEIQELLAEQLLRAEIRRQLADLPPAPQASDTGQNGWVKRWKYILPALLILGVLAYFVFRKPTRFNPAIQTPPEPGAPARQTAPAAPAPVPGKNLPGAQTPVAGAESKAGLRPLALAAYRVPDGLSGIRGQQEEPPLAQAAKAFFEKDYRQALDLLDTLPDNEPQEALSLRAHAHFGAGHFGAAARDFAALEAGGIYRREAQWYGLLARMALPGADKTALKTELQAIRRTAGHPYREAAGALLKGF